MELTLYVSALLLIAISFIHSYLGERYILMRLFKRDNLPKLFGSDDFTKRTLRFAWIGFAAIVFSLTQPEYSQSTVVKIIAITFAIHCVVAFWGSKGRHLSWIVFGTVSVLLFFYLMA
ncbi:hypothetical protein [Vibrio coralliilyticus]|uniref:hypothetical protein n=1 Tax=Vibrio coralliilyticus TaxID=190893 RepID=UPI00148CC521|nr:hypothetical protein [Vibrio coralliilyticus]NOI29247.1 hypothetical protein [Vibrio coralliilyticus]NOI48489.1 hypothetical protein [Vibrio coralliilyticus]